MKNNDRQMRLHGLFFVFVFLFFTLLSSASVCAQEALLQNHLALRKIETGPCRNLTGNVQIAMVFLDTNVDAWTDNDKAEKQHQIENAMTILQQWADTYGKELLYQLSVFQNTDDQFVKDENYEDLILFAASDRNVNGLFTYLRNMEEYDQTVVIFCLAGNGRTVAYSDWDDYPFEGIVAYQSDGTNAFLHEILHLFGAVDLYFPDVYEEAARKYFPDSIMLSTNCETHIVDDLTAYLIGWRDTISGNALSFLKETEHLTEEELASARAEELFTGYAVRKENGFTYEGQMLNGQRHGYGKITWDSGNVYTGDFYYGVRTGKGELVFINGDRYTGDFVNNARCGQGTYVWSSGDIYTGGFLNDERSGKGEIQYANGNYLSGIFQNGELNGEGVMAYANGCRYEGSFKDGNFHGYGTYTDEKGNVLEGIWENGIFVQ